MNSFGRLEIKRKTGSEPLHENGQPLATNVLAFWQWLASDLVNNSMRGQLAEYLVAYALDVADGTRIEWDAYDLETVCGIKVEVKSAAYLQSWHQTKPSVITFGIRPTYALEADTNVYSTQLKRQADVYVFALLAHQDKATLDPLNVAQWTFYVLAAALLDEQLPTQKTISLATLKRLGPKQVQFSELAAAIETVAALS